MTARDTKHAMWNGLMCRCPACGEGSLFQGFLAVNSECPVCHEELHHHRADDAPPYMVIMIVGHIIVGFMLWLEMHYRPSVWVHISLWVPLTLAMSLALLRPIKGALVGLQWALRMHGFGGAASHNRDA